MNQHNHVPGSPEWHAHRATCFNASDAPAMLGCTDKKTRTQLLQQLHSKVEREFSDYVQERVLDPGHAFEALARPLAEQILGGEDLYAVGGSADVGLSRPLSASFDGLPLIEDPVWEHKRLNAALREALPLVGPDENDSANLPKEYRVQMEQQLLVAKATRALFTASDWKLEDGQWKLVDARHCWYTSDAALRAEILAGWKQLDADLAEFTPAAPVIPVVAQPVQALPAVLVQVTGAIAIIDNFDVFETALRDFLEFRLIREPKDDQNFADLDLQIKAMKGAEAVLEGAEAQMLAQIQTVDAAKKRKDMLVKLVRDNRLMAEKLLASEKERRRGEIVAAGVTGLRDHIAKLNERLGKPYMPQVPADFGGAIRGLKSLASMEDKVSTELARAKMAASDIADRIQVNLTHLRDNAGEFKHLFPDTAAIVQKAPEDLATLVTARIAEHQAKVKQEAEAAAEKERERIRQEEAAKLQREQAEKTAAEQRQRDEAEAEAARQREAEARARQPAAAPQAALPLDPAPVAAPAPVPAAPAVNSSTVVPLRAAAPAAPTLKLGTIAERLGFALTADFLRTLGFEPTQVQNAKLYHEADFDRICVALIERIERARHGERQAA